MIATLIFFIVRDEKKDYVDYKLSVSDNKVGCIFLSLSKILKDRRLHMLAIYGGLMFMPISVVGSLWGVPFFMKKYGINNVEAGRIVSAIFLGLSFGCPFFGWLSDFLKARKRIMIISSVFSLLLFSFPLYTKTTIFCDVLLMFMYAFFTGGFLVCYASAKDTDNENKNSGLILGFMNTVNMFGGTIMQPMIGYILDKKWSGKMLGGIRDYSIADFRLALTMVPIVIFAAAVISFVIKEVDVSGRNN